jgi:flagellar motor switch protein FliM
MTGPLTQKAVDALVRGAPVGTPPDTATEAQPYDFVRPQRIPRERRAALELALACFVQSLGARLSPRLRESLDVTVAGLDQVTFSEYLQSLATPCAAFVFKVGRGPARGVVDLGNPVAFYLVDRLFGGAGQTEVPPRALTVLEQSAVRGVVEEMLALLGDAWQGGLEIAGDPPAFESSPAALEAMDPGEDALVVELELRSGPLTGPVTLALPFAALQAFLQERDVKRTEGAASSDRATPCRSRVTAALRQARLDLSVRLPAFRLSARTLAGLAAGQVLHTGYAAESAVEVHVNERLRWLGVLGQAQRYVGVRITQSVSAPAHERSSRLREGRVM